jgi:hypothetical protein
MAHVAAIKREGISTIEYAKQHALAAKSLYRWQRKLNATATVTASPSHGEAFVALRVANPVVGQPLTRCTLMLGSSLRLEMATLPEPDWLAALVRAAQGAH